MYGRFAAISLSTVTCEARALLRQVEVMMGQAPNLLRTMANVPAVLEGYLAFEAALAGGTLSLALLIASVHGCSYERCRHRALGELVGLTKRDVLVAQHGRALVIKQGRVTDDDLDTVLRAGYRDSEIMEIIAVVAVNVLTNYVALVAEVELDGSV